MQKAWTNTDEKAKAYDNIIKVLQKNEDTSDHELLDNIRMEAFTND